jgi:hypothetical protein
LVKSLDLVDTSRLSLEVVAGTGIGGLGKPLRELQEGTVITPPNSVDVGPSLLKDWDEIDEFVKVIRPPKARQFPVGGSASVNAGATLFSDGNCAHCHSGAGWTLSRRFFTPSSKNNADLAAAAFLNKGNITGVSLHTFEIANEPNGSGGNVAPAQVACVLRKVNTFSSDAGLEVKAGRPPSLPAQGQFTGYNIPSLYGLQVGAPFLHHGQAKTLTELFTDSKWIGHLQAGNAVFNGGAVLSSTQATDLANFLWSIDAAKAEIPAVTNKDACRANFP